MPHDVSLDPYAVLASLGVQTIHSVVRVTGGSDTKLWRVEHDQMTSALRVFHAQVSTFVRELSAMEIATNHGIPVPLIRAQGYWHERPVVLLSWCSGLPLAAALRQQPWRLLKLSRAFGRMQASIHGIHVAILPNTSPGDWINWYGVVDSGLEARLRQRATRAPHLLHLDYHPLNVMADRSGVSGVIDWANARAGDPRADVARTYTILAVEPHAVREPVWYRVVRRLLAQHWLAGYQETAGELRDMAPFYAWAGAVMQADLAPRVNNPDSWWQSRHLQAVARWTQQWRQRAESVGA
jgi:aminoglycoside phosphotransferase (APT) family kinase protein